MSVMWNGMRPLPADFWKLEGGKSHDWNMFLFSFQEELEGVSLCYGAHGMLQKSG